MVYSPDYQVDMGEHVFPVEKYRRWFRSLRRRGGIGPDDAVALVPAIQAQLVLVHAAEYLTQLQRLADAGQSFLTRDTPVTREILEKSTLATGGTVVAARLAIEAGVAVHLNGGFHHAFPDHGEGFCYHNAAAVAIRVLQREGFIEPAVIIDCDVHRGSVRGASVSDRPCLRLTFRAAFTSGAEPQADCGFHGLKMCGPPNIRRRRQLGILVRIYQILGQNPRRLL